MKLRKPFAWVTAAVLAASGLALGASAAQATESETEYGMTGNFVPADSIQATTNADESDFYNVWHFGPGTGYAQTAGDSRNGMTFAAGTQTQIIKGNGYDVAPPTEGAVALLEGLLSPEGQKVVASDESSLSYQVGIRWDKNGDGVWTDAAQDGWSTLRAPVGAADGMWTTSKAIGDSVAAGATASADELIAALIAADPETDIIYPISTGFLAYQPTAEVLVSSFAANGEVTNFYERPMVESPNTMPSAEYVSSQNIRPNEAEYVGWHDGATEDATDRNYVTVRGEAAGETVGLNVSGKSQILNGFAEGAFLQNAASFAQSMSIGVTEGSGDVFAQVPVFYYPQGVPGQQFTTLRALVPASGNLADATGWAPSSNILDAAGNVVVANGDYVDAATLLDAIGEHEVLGYGAFVDTDVNATITSITFNGATTNFAKAANAVVEPTDEFLSGDEIVYEPNESSVYNQWHFGPGTGYEVAIGDQARNGIVLDKGTKSQIIKGNGNDSWADASLLPDETSIAGLISGLDIVASDASALTYQVAIRVDDNGDGIWDGETWSTLRAPVDAADGDWTTSKAIGDIAAGASAPLADIVAAAGQNAYPISYGFSAYEPTEDVLVSSFTANNVTTKFHSASEVAPAGEVATEYVDDSGVRPNEDTYAGWHNGYDNTGEYETVAGENGATLGLKVTGKFQLFNGFEDDAFRANIADRVSQMSILADGDTWAQVAVNAYPAGAAKAVFTTLRAEVPASGNMSDATEWTSSKALPGVAANSATTLEAILSALGDHDVMGYGALVTEGNVATIESISFDGLTTNFTKAGETPEPEEPSNTFTDVPKSQKFFKEISWMQTNGITTGIKQADGTVVYAPKSNVTREAMAAFIYRAADANYTAPTTSPFADVKPGDKFYKEMTWMWAEGLTTGIKQADGTVHFAPKSQITREAMAAFMYRAADRSDYTAPSSSPFADVTTSTKFGKEIIWMQATGITTGIQQNAGKAKYEPKWNVTREAMAAFLYRANA